MFCFVFQILFSMVSNLDLALLRWISLISPHVLNILAENINTIVKSKKLLVRSIKNMETWFCSFSSAARKKLSHEVVFVVAVVNSSGGRHKYFTQHRRRKDDTVPFLLL